MKNNIWQIARAILTIYSDLPFWMCISWPLEDKRSVTTFLKIWKDLSTINSISSECILQKSREFLKMSDKEFAASRPNLSDWLHELLWKERKKKKTGGSWNIKGKKEQDREENVGTQIILSFHSKFHKSYLMFGIKMITPSELKIMICKSWKAKGV